jgi:exopolysaccharide biosynthesis polyprenyl glycosylphosphotransferase
MPDILPGVKSEQLRSAQGGGGVERIEPLPLIRTAPAPPLETTAIGAKSRWRRDALRRRMLAIADLGALAVAGLAVALATSGELWPLVLAPLWLLPAKLYGLYDRDQQALRHLTADEVPMLVAWAATVTALLAFTLPLISTASLGTGGAALHFAVLLLVVLMLRSLARFAWWKRVPPETVGLIGEEPALTSIQRKFDLFREMHFELASVSDVGSLGVGERKLGEIESLVAGVDRVVLASETVDRGLIERLNAVCRARQVKFSVISPLRGRALPSSRIAQLADLPIFEYSTWDASRSTLVIKRGFDLIASAAGLLLLLPLLIVLAGAIKLDSRGPVFFSQIRMGLDGRPFRMYKLRTMHADAEARLDEVVNLSALPEPAFKVRSDPRITRLGAWLRRFSLDEVPQLFNVLVGEMSIVGPRPEQVEVAARYTREERVRLSVKPGVTGPMQILGRGELTFSERLAVELDYVQDPSLSRDLQIILHTLPAVVRGTGAY